MSINPSGPKVSSRESEAELRWKLRENRPEFQFQMASRDLRLLRQAQERLCHLSTQLRDAFDCEIRSVKDKLHKIIDEI